MAPDEGFWEERSKVDHDLSQKGTDGAKSHLVWKIRQCRLILSIRPLVKILNVDNDIHLQLLCEHRLSTRSWYGQRPLVDKRFDVELVGSRLWRTRPHPLEITRRLQDSYITLDTKCRKFRSKYSTGFYLTWTRSPRTSCAWWWGRGTGWAGTLWCPPWPPPWTAPPAPSPPLWWLPTLRLGETLPLCLLTLFPSVRSIVASPPSNDVPENCLFTAGSDFWSDDEDDGLLSISPSQWKSLGIIHFIVWDFERLILVGGGHSRDSHREGETSKLMEQRRRLERSIEEESLQMKMIIMWRRWSFVMNSHFKSCFQLRWMSSTLWRKLNS